jgi:HK97 family phage major capsid protein
MTRLNDYLKAAIDGEVKELADSMSDEETIRHNGEVVTVRELLLSTDIGATGLIQTEVLKTVIEGADQVKCFRDALPTYNMSSKTLDINVGETSSYAPIVAEGAEVPIETQTYTPVEFTAEKRAVRPAITNELIADSVVDVIAAEVSKAGKRIENSLNQKSLTVMLDGATLEKDTEETARGVDALADAIALVQEAGFIPDSVVMHPEALAMVIKEFVPGNYDNSAVTSGSLGKVLGLNVYVTSVTDDSDTYTWGYGADGEIGMIVFDSASAAAIGMREDISVENYNDVIRDMQSMVVKSRFDVKVLNGAAICRVKY